jgi:hypothetical protein
MAKSKLTSLQALANMKKHMVNHEHGFQGYCHRTCQNAWGLPAKYASAIDAWNSIPKEHKNTDPLKAPISAPHFYDGGHYGHVVLQSDKKGMVFSTDAPVTDFVGEVSWDWFVKHWGKKYLGWSNYYNDEELQLGPMPS